MSSYLCPLIPVLFPELPDTCSVPCASGYVCSYLLAELEHWMVGFVFPGLAVSQEAALTHMDVHTLHTSIPEYTGKSSSHIWTVFTQFPV